MYAHLYASPPVSSRVVAGPAARAWTPWSPGAWPSSPRIATAAAGELATAAREALKDRAPPTVVVGFPSPRVPSPASRPGATAGTDRWIRCRLRTAAASPGALRSTSTPQTPSRPAPGGGPRPAGAAVATRRSSAVRARGALARGARRSHWSARSVVRPSTRPPAANRPPVPPLPARPLPHRRRSHPASQCRRSAEAIDVGPTPGYIQVAPNGRFAYICQPRRGRGHRPGHDD